jgi:hypothetical protein
MEVGGVCQGESADCEKVDLAKLRRPIHAGATAKNEATKCVCKRMQMQNAILIGRGPPGELRINSRVCQSGTRSVQPST